MEKKRKAAWISAAVMLVVFAVYTILVKKIDVAKIGPQETFVGFASVNSVFRDAVAYNETFFKISDILGYLAIAVCCVFGLTGLVQLIRTKSFKKVDTAIYVLGGFYIVVMAFYALFEIDIVNYRPIVLDNAIEASYPSSHTVLAVCVFVSAIFEAERYVRNKTLKHIAKAACVVLTFATVLLRMFSGVHWISDIIGGVLLSCALILLFIAADRTFVKAK